MRTAIIGGGISGLGAAYLLHKAHDITLYEQAPDIGGHSRTIDVATPTGSVPVDTGFIVYNRRNYPYLSALFDALDVPVSKSRMSFGISINQGWLEYGTHNIFTLLAQKRNLFRTDFYRMLRDILFFNRQVQNWVLDNPQASIRECLEALRLGAWFRDYYLLAMSGAIWSMSADQILDFPAHTLIGFLNNHGLLTVNDQPQWYTVRGGSREYVQRLSAPFAHQIRTGCAVRTVTRHADSIEIQDSRGATEHYDHVIFACHSDQALKLIVEPTTAEQNILGNIRYQNNRVVVHGDTTLMPRNRKAWSSWVYLADQSARLSLTYWMNNLQPLSTDTPIFVTVNPGHEPDQVYDTHEFTHPVFDHAAIAAQQCLDEVQGQDRLWFCGAWQGYGFHEDGLGSAVRLAERFGMTWSP